MTRFTEFEATPFYRPCGVEYTYVDPAEFKIKRQNRMEAMTRRYQEYAKEMQALHSAGFGQNFDPTHTADSDDHDEACQRGLFHKDPGCVEYSTPVCTSWAEMREQFEYGLAVAEMHGLELQTENVCSGMAHVNIGVSPKTAGKVLFDVQARPYFALAFCRPQELDCCPPSIMMNYTSANRMALPNSAPYDSTKYVDIAYHTVGACEFGARLEFRMFSSPENWEESSAQVALAQRYTEYVSKTSPVRRPVMDRLMCEVVTQNFEFKDCLAKYKQFIHDLELPWAYYSRYEYWLRDCHKRIFGWVDPDYNRSSQCDRVIHELINQRGAQSVVTFTTVASSETLMEISL